MHGTYEAMDGKMKNYLEKVKKVIQSFDTFKITRIARSDNKCADALSRLDLSFETYLGKSISVKKVLRPSIDEEPTITTIVEAESS